MRRLFLVLICAISCGCRDTAEPVVEKAASAKPRAAVRLSVLVVDDPELAKGVRLLAGEWSERSGGELSVTEMPLEELLATEKLAADVVIYPSRHLGTLAMRGWLRPVRKSVLDDSALAWGDFLTTVRDQSVRYGGEVYALPLGEMPLVLAWSRGIPKKLPTTWEQFGAAGIGLHRSDGAPFPLTREFIARAVTVTSPADRATLFFDPQTMAARLTTPQLVRALEWLVDAAKKSDGRLASVSLPREAGNAALIPLLAAEEVYTASLDRWEKTVDGSSPCILGFAGRVASVTTVTRNAASAFKLLPWLVSGSAGGQLSQRSKATLWFRASQVAQADKWLSGKSDDNRARWLTEMLSRGDAYLLPRIPGIDRYLAELEVALEKAVSGDQSAKQALATAQDRWFILTDQLGREQQRTAFNRHLGLSE
jgi:ABC-type glycerol-3-phosphate transport system substrate-binding protein